MQDTDIEGLDPRNATEYVLAFVTTLKKTETDLASVTEDVTKWTRRVALAVEKGEEELAGMARAKLAEIEGKKAALETELADLRLKVVILKEKLQHLRGRFQKSVDTDVLLAELEMLVGKKDDLADRFKVEEAGAKVEELKKKMADGSARASPGAKPGGTPGSA
jgi:phage shock protein A